MTYTVICITLPSSVPYRVGIRVSSDVVTYVGIWGNFEYGFPDITYIYI